MTSSELQEKAAKFGYHGLFGHRETLQEAYDYAMQLIDTIPPEDRIAVMTGLHVLMNTIAIERAKEKPLPEQIRNFLQKAYCMELDIYVNVMGTEDGWKEMQANVQRWYCNLDSSEAKRFLDWCEK